MIGKCSASDPRTQSTRHTPMKESTFGETVTRSPSDLMPSSQKEAWSTRGYQSSTIDINVDVAEVYDDGGYTDSGSEEDGHENAHLYTNGNFSEPCTMDPEHKLERDLADVIRAADDFGFNVDIGHADEPDAPSPLCTR